MTNSPDTVFVGGRLFTAGWAQSRAGGVAVIGGAIAAIGSDAEIRALADRRTRVVEVGDGLLVPGFHDAHAHPIAGGIELLQCDLSEAADAAATLASIAAYADAHPNEPWILGGGWTMAHFPGGTPTAQALDRVVSDRPVALFNRDHHGVWVNTAALRQAGITRDTPDPSDGRIERAADGQPSGVLHEGAMALLDGVKPGVDRAFGHRALLAAQEVFFAHGIVGWQDAYVGATAGMSDVLDAYLDALDGGTLRAKVTAALWWERDAGLDQLPSLLARRAQVERRGRGDHLNASTVKIMVDGVAENFTAAMSSPYLDACGHPTGNRGIAFLAPDALSDTVTALDAAGFQVHFHAIGDRAVTLALDAVEAARRANGQRGTRHHLAHLQVVSERDALRFALLGATANLQMLWASDDEQLRELTFPHLDPRLVARHYPFGDLVRAGTPLAAGSDWPISSVDPLAGMHVGVNRTDPFAPGEPLGAPEQALSLADALAAYTAGSARINGRGRTSGRLLVGASADLAVLSADPFLTGSQSIAHTRVLSTWIDGVAVHEG